MLKSLLVNKDVKTWCLAGCQYSRQSIITHIRKSMFTIMKFEMDFLIPVDVTDPLVSSISMGSFCHCSHTLFVPLRFIDLVIHLVSCLAVKSEHFEESTQMSCHIIL